MTERATPRRSPASAPLVLALLAVVPLLASAYLLRPDGLLASHAAGRPRERKIDEAARLEAA